MASPIEERIPRGTTPSTATYPALRDRLPTLFEVLSRETMAPVDLFNFYIYMRDQQRSVDYLDFWLDVQQHLAVCRNYVSQLRRSVIFDTPELNKAASKRSSQLLEATAPDDPGEGPAHSRSVRASREEDRRISAFLRSDSLSQQSAHPSQKQSGESSHSHDSAHTPTDVTRSRAGTNMTGTGTGTEQPRPSFMTSNLGDYSGSSPGENDSSDAQHRIHRSDIQASAEKILYTYLLPGSEREIILPPTTLNAIQAAIEEERRGDPDVFSEAKEYVFQAMERDAFPGFLRSKALGNLLPPHLLLRLIFGLLAMFAGFWAAFTLIFLNKTRGTRAYIILPFAFGVYSLVSHQYTLDPLVALVGFFEHTFFRFSRVEEPFVKVLLRKRALIALAYIVLITAAVVVLFVFVPGRRL